MTVTVKHATLTGAAANPNVLVDGPKWDADHTITGLATVAGTGSAADLTGTLPAASVPTPTATTLGGIKSLANVSHKWINSIGTDGTPTQTQPAFSDISGSPLTTPLVILCAGQSQNVKSKTFAWSPSSNAKIWNNTVGTVSTGTAFIALDGANANFPQVLASNISIATGRPVYLINSSFSGQPISHWLSGTGAPDMYADAVANVAAAMTALSLTKIDLFVWWQGEGDTGPLNASYIANHATMMTRFWGNSWFPQETPVIVNSIASTAIAGNADADNMNSLLLGVVNADPDKRRYVYAASLSSATYWDGADVGHMTAQGYYSVGAMAASAFLNGPGRNSLKNVLVSPSTGNVVFGSPGFSSAAISYNGNSTGATLPSTGATMQIAGPDAGAVYPIYDAFGNFTNFVGRRANGTLASKTALATDDLITGFGAQGYDGSAYSSGNRAAFNFSAQATWTGSNHSTYATLGLTPNGSTTSATYHRWDVGSYTISGSTSGTTKVQATAAASGTLTLPAATDTLIGKATTDTLTNKTYDTAGTGNSFSINGVAATANTGTGAVVRATSPTLVTPVLGAATATTINGAALDNLAWTSYTPTITASSGTFTTVSATGRYKQIGKTIMVQVDVTITTAGTAAGLLRATLPFTSAAFNFVGSAKENALTGKSGVAQVNPSSNIMYGADATTATFIANGAEVIFGMTYEIP